MGEMIEELKPCPFCGETRLTIEDNQMVQDVHVLCKDCGAKTSFDGIRYAVAGRWNGRPIEGVIQDRIEELEAENRRLRETLEMLAKFAGELEKKYYPTPPSAKFDTIKYYAEKALKGAGE